MSSASAAAIGAYGILSTQEPDGLRSLLDEVWAEGPNAALRDWLGYDLGELNEIEPYWCHEDEEPSADADEGLSADDEDELDGEVERAALDDRRHRAPRDRAR